MHLGGHSREGNAPHSSTLAWRNRAETRYDNKGSGWRAFVLVCISAVLAAVAVCFLLPDMIQMVDNMIGILTQSDKILK